MIHPQRIEPEPGHESVWNYPRSPRLERSRSLPEGKSLKEIKIVFNGVIIAQSDHTYRILETSHPPVYYLPMGNK